MHTFPNLFINLVGLQVTKVTGVFRKLQMHICIPHTNFVSQTHNNKNAANYVSITTAGYQNKVNQAPPPQSKLFAAQVDAIPA